jgi:hypothetical protein
MNREWKLYVPILLPQRSGHLILRSTMKLEVVGSSETLIIAYKTTQSHRSEAHNLNSYLREITAIILCFTHFTFLQISPAQVKLDPRDRFFSHIQVSLIQSLYFANRPRIKVLDDTRLAKRNLRSGVFTVVAVLFIFCLFYYSFSVVKDYIAWNDRATHE